MVERPMKSKDHTANKKVTQSGSRKVASKLLKKSRLLQANKKNGKPGVKTISASSRGVSGQVHGLFDGLSHLYTAQGVRQKAVPLYSFPFKRVQKLKPASSSNNNNKDESRSTKSPWRVKPGEIHNDSVVKQGRHLSDCRSTVPSPAPSTLGGRGNGWRKAATSAPTGRGRGRGSATIKGKSPPPPQPPLMICM